MLLLLIRFFSFLRCLAIMMFVLGQGWIILQFKVEMITNMLFVRKTGDDINKI